MDLTIPRPTWLCHVLRGIDRWVDIFVAATTLHGVDAAGILHSICCVGMGGGDTCRQHSLHVHRIDGKHRARYETLLESVEPESFAYD